MMTSVDYDEESRQLDILSEEPLLLRTPLVRFGQKVTIGAAEDTWTEWVEADKGS